MHIRCRACHSTIWIEPSAQDSGSESVRCKTCSQSYRVEGAHRLPGGAARLDSAAKDIAREHGIDMPGAYSVLFGVMTAAEVRELGSSGSAACRTSADPPAAASPRAPGYDRAFQPAIDEGLLTPQQASQRGARDAFAAMIAHRHGLPLASAYEIADNRVSLLACLRGRKPEDQVEIPLTVRAGPGVYAAWSAGGFLFMALLAAVAYQSSPDPSAPRIASTRTVHNAEVRMDERGRVLQISAPDPRSALKAYCAIRTDRPMEAIDVMPDALSGARRGLFRDKDDPGKAYLIEILEDRVAGAWVVGDGLGEIRTARAPESAVHAAGARQGP